MIRSHTCSGFAFVGADLGVVAVGCEVAVGPVGLWEQAPTTVATVDSMIKRSVRDIVCSRLQERHRYGHTWVTKHIVGGTLIHHGAPAA